MAGENVSIKRGDEIEVRDPPNCPSCGQLMRDYGGSAGHICCEWKLLYRAGGWFDERGLHVRDDRLAGGSRHVDEVVTERPRSAG